MESLEAKKIRLLSKWLFNYPNMMDSTAEAAKMATSILSLLDEIEQAYWVTRQEADGQTHCMESYDKSN